AAPGARQHLVFAAGATHAREYGVHVPDAPVRVRRAGTPAGRVEMRRAERAIARCGGADGLLVRRDLPPAHDHQGSEPRYCLVRHARSRVAGSAREHGAVAERGSAAVAPRAERRAPAVTTLASLVGVEKSYGSWTVFQGL